MTLYPPHYGPRFKWSNIFGFSGFFLIRWWLKGSEIQNYPIWPQRSTLVRNGPHLDPVWTPYGPYGPRMDRVWMDPQTQCACPHSMRWAGWPNWSTLNKKQRHHKIYVGAGKATQPRLWGWSIFFDRLLISFCLILLHNFERALDQQWVHNEKGPLKNLGVLHIWCYFWMVRGSKSKFD